MRCFLQGIVDPVMTNKEAVEASKGAELLAVLDVGSKIQTDRVAFTPIEFASLFGREKTFTYRLLYKGKIKCIKPGNGRILIPANEVQKLIGEAKAYS